MSVSHTTSLTTLEAVTAYARTLNTLDVSHLETLLADDFHYASQWVFEELESKTDFLEYFHKKLDAIRKTESKLRVEIGEFVGCYPFDHTALVFQDGEEPLMCVLAKVKDGFITRLDACCAPDPMEADRSGFFPGRDEQ